MDLGENLSMDLGENLSCVVFSLLFLDLRFCI